MCTGTLLCSWADAPLNKAASKHKGCRKGSSVSVLFFVNQCTFPSLILNTMLPVHAALSFTLQGYELCARPCDPLGHLVPELRTVPTSTCLCVCGLRIRLLSSGPLRLTKSQKTAPIPGPWNAIHSLCASPPDPVFLSAPPGWEAVNTTTTEKENHAFPPRLLVSMGPIFTQNQPRSDSN